MNKIKNYKDFALFDFSFEYMSNEDIENFNLLYKNSNIEILEDEFFNYFINLDSNELIIFLESVKNHILLKKYMNNKNKAYKIYEVILNGLFWFLEETNIVIWNNNILKSFFDELWNFIILLSDNDKYLLEKYKKDCIKLKI